MNVAEKKVRIAIIDSGIDSTKADLYAYVTESIGFTVNASGYIEKTSNPNPTHEHGTIIAVIIKHFCKNIDIISINILNKKLATDGRILIHAFDKALAYKPDIIHLSLGTTKWIYRFPLYRLVTLAGKNNCIVVAAASNTGIKSYPSHFKNVIRVKSARMPCYTDISYNNGYFFAHHDAKEILAYNSYPQIDGYCGTSYAAAYITGHIAEAILANKSKDKTQIINYLILKKE